MIIYNHTIIYQSEATDYAVSFVRSAQCARVQFLPFRTHNAVQKLHGFREDRKLFFNTPYIQRSDRGRGTNAARKVTAVWVTSTDRSFFPLCKPLSDPTSSFAGNNTKCQMYLRSHGHPYISTRMQTVLGCGLNGTNRILLATNGSSSSWLTGKYVFTLPGSIWNMVKKQHLYYYCR